VRQIPRSEPKFHQFEMFDGVGKSINALLIILIVGEDFRREIFISLWIGVALF